MMNKLQEKMNKLQEKYMNYSEEFRYPLCRVIDCENEIYAMCCGFSHCKKHLDKHYFIFHDDKKNNKCDKDLIIDLIGYNNELQRKIYLLENEIKELKNELKIVWKEDEEYA